MPHALHFVLERLQLLRREHRQFHAALDEFFFEIFLVVLDKIATPFASLFCLRANELLRLRLETLKNLRVRHEEIIFVSIIPNRHVLLNFVDFGRIGDAEAVLLPVDGALLNCGERLAPAHCNRIGTERAPEFEIHFAARNSDLESGNVLGRPNRVLAVRHLTKAVVRRSEIRDALRRENFFVVLAARRVDDAPSFLIIVESPRHRADQKMFVENRHDARRIRRQINRAVRDHFNAF